jgi:hypothetical protein
LLDQKVTKNQGFIKIGCVSKPEVSLAIQGMKDWNKSRHLSLLCIATHMPFAHTSVKNRYPIFLMPVPSKRIFTLGSNVGHGFGFYLKCQGVGTGLIEILHPPEAEDEGKQRGQCPAFCGETPASRAVRMLFPNFQAFPNLLGSRAFTEAYICVKFIFSLDFLCAPC